MTKLSRPPASGPTTRIGDPRSVDGVLCTAVLVLAIAACGVLLRASCAFAQEGRHGSITTACAGRAGTRDRVARAKDTEFASTAKRRARQRRGQVDRGVAVDLESTRLTLAQACVAEATWSLRDGAAILHVLSRRWVQRRTVEPGVTLETVTRRYVRVFRRAEQIRRSGKPARSRWVLSLQWGRGALTGQYWPWPRADWRNHVHRWDAVQRLVVAWLAGEVPDPCRGRAMHWGGAMDPAWPGLVRVDCGPTSNRFYRVSGGEW